MKSLLLIFVFFGASSFAATAAKSELLSFKDWKRLEQQKATEQLVQLKSKNAKENPVVIDEKDKKQKEWNYEVAKDLGLKDYFVLYLSQQPQPLKMTEIATQLSTEEIAELLLLYLGTLEAPAQPAETEASPVAKTSK